MSFLQNLLGLGGAGDSLSQSMGLGGTQNNTSGIFGLGNATEGGGGLLGLNLFGVDNSMRLPLALSMMGGGSNSQAFTNAANLMANMGPKIEEKRLAADQKNKTLAWMKENRPDLAAMVEAGMPIPEAWAQVLNPQKGRNLKEVGGQLYDVDNNSWISPPGGGDEYSKRRLAAEQNGLTPDHPAYQSFILTGRMPREDQAPLTATDKKAILEADELVAANENAIKALEQAEKLSDKANSGWLAGPRASIGNNMPDLLVPDFVASPESSAATADMDNAVVGQALASLKTIFGGNPTEGERKILLELQGSSSMPKAVRDQVFARAKEMAMRRLEFNKQRAAALRGGTYYQQQPGAGAGGAVTAPGGVVDYQTYFGGQ